MENETTSFKFFLKTYGRCCKSFGASTFKHLFPPVICKDGTFMSVQASPFHHCYPVDNLEDFEYDEFEVRTDLEDNLLSPYLSDEKYTYNYVDVFVIDTLIEKHGGIDEEAVQKYIVNNS